MMSWRKPSSNVSSRDHSPFNLMLIGLKLSRNLYYDRGEPEGTLLLSVEDLFQSFQHDHQWGSERSDEDHWLGCARIGKPESLLRTTHYIIFSRVCTLYDSRRRRTSVVIQHWYLVSKLVHMERLIIWLTVVSSSDIIRFGYFNWWPQYSGYLSAIKQ